MTEGKKSVEIKAGIEPELKKAEKFEQQLAASVSKAIEGAIVRAFERALKSQGGKISSAINDSVQRTPVERVSDRLRGAARSSRLKKEAELTAQYREYLYEQNPASALNRKHKQAARVLRERDRAFAAASASSKAAQEDAMWARYDRDNAYEPDTNTYDNNPVASAVTRQQREEMQSLSRAAKKAKRLRNTANQTNPAYWNQQALQKAQIATAKFQGGATSTPPTVSAQVAQQLATAGVPVGSYKIAGAKAATTAANQTSATHWNQVAMQKAMTGIAKYQGGHTATPPTVTPQIGQQLAAQGIAANMFNVKQPPGGGGGGGGGAGGGASGGGGMFGAFGSTMGAVARGYLAYQMVSLAAQTAGGLVKGQGGGALGGGAPMYFDGMSQIPLYGMLAARGGQMFSQYAQYNNLQNLSGEVRALAGPGEALSIDTNPGMYGVTSYLDNAKEMEPRRKPALINALAFESKLLGNRFGMRSADVLSGAIDAGQASGRVVEQRDQIELLRQVTHSRQLGISGSAFGGLMYQTGGLAAASRFGRSVAGSMGDYASYDNIGRVAEMGGQIGQAGLMGGYMPSRIGDFATVAARNGNMLSSMAFESSLRERGVSIAASGGGGYRETLYAMLATPTGRAALAKGGGIGINAYGRMMKELESGTGLAGLGDAVGDMFGRGVAGNLLSAGLLGGTYSQRSAALESSGSNRGVLGTLGADPASLLLSKSQFTPTTTIETIQADNNVTQAASKMEEATRQEIYRNVTLMIDAANRFSEAAARVGKSSVKFLEQLQRDEKQVERDLDSLGVWADRGPRY
jgi:hypothetical protein